MGGLPQDTGVEVPIPLIDDVPSSALDKDLPAEPEPETPKQQRNRVPGHKPAKSSVSRPTPLPIDLPTQSDIAVDMAAESADDSDSIVRGGPPDLERGDAVPMRGLEPGRAGANGTTPDTAAFSPRISGENTSLLKHISIEPPTPTATKSSGSANVAAKRRSKSPEDLLNDDPPPAIPITPLATKADGTASQPNGTTLNENAATPVVVP